MTGPLPGVRRLDHVGLTVPDLDQAQRFLVEVLGCEFLYALGPFGDDDGEWMQEHLGVHPRARVPQNRFFRLPDGTVLEVFAYEAPDQRREPPRNSDVGGHHLALYVDDLDAAVAALHEHGVEVLGEPTASSSHHEGQRWVYFRAPWGLQLELVSYPHGKAWNRLHENASGTPQGSTA
ncbi:VOC family protein [Angustibacter aerolatus]